MSTQPSTAHLHLPSLSVKSFRGIADLSIPRLGKVTLIAGMNGIGKTTLLEAVRLYAARGDYSVISSILRSREEFTTVIDEDGDELSIPDFETLAYGRHPSEDTCISIGPVDYGPKLNIRFFLEPWHHQLPLIEDIPDVDPPLLTVEFQGVMEGISSDQLFHPYRYRRAPGRPRRPMPESKLPGVIPCESIGPSVMGNDSMARFWDSVALTDYETRAVQALQLIYGPDVDRVAMIGDEERRIPGRSRRAVVKIRGQERPVPLKSLGDGAVRIFSTALGIANSRNGFFVIDEAENGIHHSVQADFWKMVLKTSSDNNVQVLATTHSWDCVVGFSHAALEIEETEGRMVRIDRLGDQMRIVEYTEEDLEVVARQRIEVR